jgi:hypothetical protein
VTERKPPDDQTLPMLPAGENDRYRAVIPAGQTAATWDLVYFLEALDQRGNGRIHPDPNQETPYIIVRQQRSFTRATLDGGRCRQSWRSS